MRPLLRRAHRLRVTRNTDRGPDIVLGNRGVDSARRQLEIWVGILRSGTPMNGSGAYPLMRDWANTTGPRSVIKETVMDEETNQQQNDDNDNDSSACHLPPFLKIGVDLACLAHARQRSLAASAFADDSKRLPAFDGETQPVQRRKAALRKG
jgi:hypothetical protein